nr:hypothetical protein GCM10020241_42520 [Streptoalloteichus tenebrarius]
MTPQGVARRAARTERTGGAGAGEADDTSGVSPPDPATGKATRERGTRPSVASPALDHFE